MSRITIPHISTTFLLAACLSITAVGYGLFAAHEVSASPVFHILANLVPGGIFALWVWQDCRAYRFSAGVDQGYFVVFAWQVFMPYYLFRTRGIRGGLRASLGFLVLFGVAVGVGILVYLLAAR